MFKFMCVVEMVISSAYVMSCVCLGSGGMSEMYMLKSVGVTTPPSRTPSFGLALGGCSVSKRCVCLASLYVVSDELSNGVGYTSVYYGAFWW